MTTPLMTYLENEGKKTKQLGRATIWCYTRKKEEREVREEIEMVEK